MGDEGGAASPARNPPNSAPRPPPASSPSPTTPRVPLLCLGLRNGQRVDGLEEHEPETAIQADVSVDLSPTLVLPLRCPPPVPPLP